MTETQSAPPSVELFTATSGRAKDRRQVRAETWCDICRTTDRFLDSWRPESLPTADPTNETLALQLTWLRLLGHEDLAIELVALAHLFREQAWSEGSSRDREMIDALDRATKYMMRLGQVPARSD